MKNMKDDFFIYDDGLEDDEDFAYDDDFEEDEINDDCYDNDNYSVCC